VSSGRREGGELFPDGEVVLVFKPGMLGHWVVVLMRGQLIKKNWKRGK